MITWSGEIQITICFFSIDKKVRWYRWFHIYNILHMCLFNITHGTEFNSVGWGFVPSEDCWLKSYNECNHIIVCPLSTGPCILTPSFLHFYVALDKIICKIIIHVNLSCNQHSDGINDFMVNWIIYRQHLVILPDIVCSDKLVVHFLWFKWGFEWNFCLMWNLFYTLYFAVHFSSRWIDEW